MRDRSKAVTRRSPDTLAKLQPGEKAVYLPICTRTAMIGATGVGPVDVRSLADGPDDEAPRSGCDTSAGPLRASTGVHGPLRPAPDPSGWSAASKFRHIQEASEL